MSRGIQLDCFSFKLLVGPSIEAAPNNVRRNPFSVPKPTPPIGFPQSVFGSRSGKEPLRFLFQENSGNISHVVQSAFCAHVFRARVLCF
ncbi:hypothetical protein CEXT_97101 [Caerostris extrusa]|uniref:Uncharacterized protein n=1 Tax=Caerostris extrusa TaxID=172846 RepID=A0AAV4RDM1_CAEEX|nr:hypothetical protein CEXT_97101 [Caerostris extrusa]